MLAKGLSSLLQQHSLKASIPWHPAFFIVQLSHPYMTTGKTIALTRWTFVSKVMSLLFNNTVSGFVIAFLLRSKHLLISWLQSPSSVILEPKKIKSVTAFLHPLGEISVQLLLSWARTWPCFSETPCITDVGLGWAESKWSPDSLCLLGMRLSICPGSDNQVKKRVPDPSAATA